MLRTKKKTVVVNNVDLRSIFYGSPFPPQNKKGNCDSIVNLYLTILRIVNLYVYSKNVLFGGNRLPSFSINRSQYLNTY